MKENRRKGWSRRKWRRKEVCQKRGGGKGGKVGEV